MLGDGQRTVILRLGLASVLAFSVGHGCAPREEGRIAASSEPSPTQEECVIETTEDPTVNALTNGAHAAVIARVESISPPRWNTTTGEAPREDPEWTPPAQPLRYRIATLAVQRVMWSSDELPIEPAEELEVHLLGDGSETGCEVGGAPIPIRENEISGRVEERAQVLVLLARRDFRLIDMEKDIAVPTTITRPAGNYLGIWTISGSRAVSFDPERSAPLDPLIERMKTERARGARPEDDRGRRNPIED